MNTKRADSDAGNCFCWFVKLSVVVDKNILKKTEYNNLIAKRVVLTAVIQSVSFLINVNQYNTEK